MSDSLYYYRIINFVTLLGKNKVSSYYYASIVCTRWHYDEPKPYRIETFKVPLSLRNIPFDRALLLYFDKEDPKRVVHFELIPDPLEETLFDEEIPF